MLQFIRASKQYIFAIIVVVLKVAAGAVISGAKKVVLILMKRTVLIIALPGITNNTHLADSCIIYINQNKINVFLK